MPLIVPEKVAEQFREQMKKPDLVFVTKLNQDVIMNDVKEMMDADRDGSASENQRAN